MRGRKECENVGTENLAERTLGEGIGTPWLRPFQKVKNP